MTDIGYFCGRCSGLAQAAGFSFDALLVRAECTNCHIVGQCWRALSWREPPYHPADFIISSKPHNPEHHTPECNAKLAEAIEQKRGMYGCSCKRLEPRANELENLLRELEAAPRGDSDFWRGHAAGVRAACEQVRALLLRSAPAVAHRGGDLEIRGGKGRDKITVYDPSQHTEECRAQNAEAHARVSNSGSLVMIKCTCRKAKAFIVAEPLDPSQGPSVTLTLGDLMQTRFRNAGDGDEGEKK